MLQTNGEKRRRIAPRGRVPLRERYNDPKTVAEPFYRTCRERAVILPNKRETCPVETVNFAM
jgi:hypothetical protein